MKACDGRKYSVRMQSGVLNEHEDIPEVKLETETRLGNSKLNNFAWLGMLPLLLLF